MLTSASSDLGLSKFGDSYYYLKNQLLHGLTFGLAGFLVTAFTYYRRWEKLALPFFLLALVMLLLLFSPLGLLTKGATRWLDLGFISFQPAEILKLAFVLYIAAWLAKNEKRGKSLSEGFLPFIILVGIVTFLILKQPSTTTAFLIAASAFCMYFAAGAKIRFFVGAILVTVIALLVAAYTLPEDNYRIMRIRTFLEPETADVLSTGYQVEKTTLAIGSGGIWGVGYGNSVSKLKQLPEQIGDSIFAVIAEEFGFVGSGLLIFAFGFLVLRCINMTRKVPDAFGRFLVIGFASLIGFQAFVNIGAVSGLIPFTGVPLPFISFGGTALAVFLTMSGIIVNVSRYRR